MRIRRVLFIAAVAAIVVVPLWLMFARALFGAPLGAGLLMQALFAPLVAAAIGLVVGATYLRRDVRTTKTLTTRDAALLFPWLLVWLILGLAITDTSGGRTASAITAVFGDEAMPVSNAVASLSLYAVLLGGAVILWLQLRAFFADTRARLRAFADEVQQRRGVQQAPRQADDAVFERIDGPQAGQQITLEPDDEPPTR